MNRRVLSLLLSLVSATFVFAQRPQTSPGVGNAVLLATNSIQMERDSVVVSGDVIVNAATNGPVFGEAALSLDRSVTTPAGYRLAATSIDLDQSAVAGGDVYYNTLTNDGTIAGTRFSPLALPVYATLPLALTRPPGTANVSVADNGLLPLEEGAYGDLVIGKSAKVTLLGGGYAFRSITIARGGELRYSVASDIVVSGRAEIGALAIVAPADGSGLTPSALRIQVDGINGNDGALQSTPPAVHVGQGGKVSGTIYATAGAMNIEQDFVGNGAFFARDIFAGRNGRFTLNSAFNQPPLANAQVVFTSGTTPLLITLTGSDAEGSALTFSIVSGPSAGTLSALTPSGPTSATVTYTPNAANVSDSFTFRVRDSAGATGDAVVTINPGEVDAQPTTVIAFDGSAQTKKDVATTLAVTGTAPSGVSITFTIASGASHGSLSAITQGTEVPQRTATVVYTPTAGYTGPDAFDFTACGVISSVNVCDTATFSITVVETLADPPAVLAHDVEVSTIPNTEVEITLGASSIESTSRRAVTMSTSLLPAAIAGNVADSDNDNLGDNANALPGSVPVFMSAGVNQSGGAGSNGTVRMQFEWDVANLSGVASSLRSAEVILPTHRGTTDSLDTSFHWGTASGDGNLTNSDFESGVQAIAGAVMPVPAEMQIGANGTFSFTVLNELIVSAQRGHNFFVVQGRVDESGAATARGLEVRTTASGNTGDHLPMLAVTTATSLSYRVTSLPANGTLRSGTQSITTVPFDLAGTQVSYIPNTNFTGSDTFTFSVSNGLTAASANVNIRVALRDCATDGVGCNNGRD